MTKSTHLAACALALLLIPSVLPAGNVPGKEYTHEIGANAKFHLFVPEEVTLIRGVIFSSDYFDKGSKHPSVRIQQLNITWLKAIAKARLPEKIPADKDFKLLDIDPKTGWLGYLKHGGDGRRWHVEKVEIYPYDKYPHEKSEAQWLPNEEVAQAWLARNRLCMKGAALPKGKTAPPKKPGKPKAAVPLSLDEITE